MLSRSHGRVPQWARPCDRHGCVYARHARVLTRPCLSQDTPTSSFTPAIELFYRWNALDTAVSFSRHARVTFHTCGRTLLPVKPSGLFSQTHARAYKYTPVRNVTRPCLLGDTPVWVALLNNCSLHTAVSNRWHARVNEQFPKRKNFLFGNLIFSQWSRYGFDKNQY